ncbi:unnamed protein product [Rhizophagus irregularis]|uniref:Bas1p n=1 Tax=Rhizophagus irregularis TaxID=588596 RepID=A0A916ELA4_9GLOM|nr:myb-like protein L isoform X2 [Rhizophagus irregularis DAOM 181602=DAOM 197198]CAB4496099.1 unnamed protein product [Rhizophagus irregularis]CAB5210122.1 unnamed protein product [Rhizophagus irregularis]CAB5396213.1 unnamed protein product [Rhizophagus irregularis]
MYVQHVLYFANKIFLKGIEKRHDFRIFNNYFIKCFGKYNIPYRTFTKKTNSSIPLSNKFKSSTEAKSLIKSLEEESIKLAKVYNWKEWKEEETKLLFLASEIHGNRWKYIHKHYFNYRSLYSIKCKWDRENLRIENNHKNIISKWTPEEDKILLKGFEKYGRQWRKISRLLPNKESLQVLRRFCIINYTKRGHFTEEEDKLLCDLIIKYGGNHWTKIADDMNRPISTIKRRFKFVLLNSSKDIKWTDQENKLISDSIIKYGKDWRSIQKLLPHRSVSSIKEHVRWCPLADPYYKSGFWEVNEIIRLIKAVRLYGKSWQKVSKYVKTRSPFQCRIYFRNSFTKKNLESHVLNLELKGIQSIFPVEMDGQDFLEKLAAEQLLIIHSYNYRLIL